MSASRRCSARLAAKSSSNNSRNGLDLSLLQSAQRVTRAKAGRIAMDNSIKTTFFEDPRISSLPSEDSWSKAPYKETDESSLSNSTKTEESDSAESTSSDDSWSRNTHMETDGPLPSSSTSSDTSWSQIPHTETSSPSSISPATRSPSPSSTLNSPLSSAPSSPIDPSSPTLCSPASESPIHPIYFSPCTHPSCPIPTLHNAGLYLHRGLPPLRPHNLFGYSNPPPAVWGALNRLKEDRARRRDLWTLAGFVGVHVEGEEGGEEGWERGLGLGPEGMGDGRVAEGCWGHVDYAQVAGWAELG